MNSENGEERLASWEKHTKGIGSKLLQKFGFNGRLGAKETGIASAIEVNVRPTNVGLGFRNVDTKSELNVRSQELKSVKSCEEKKRKFMQFSSGGKKSGDFKKQKDSHSKVPLIESLLSGSESNVGRGNRFEGTQKAQGYRRENRKADSDDDSFGNFQDHDLSEFVIHSNESNMSADESTHDFWRFNTLDVDDTAFIQNHYQKHSMKFEKSAPPSYSTPLQLTINNIDTNLKEKEQLRRARSNNLTLVEERLQQNTEKLANLLQILQVLRVVDQFIQKLQHSRLCQQSIEEVMNDFPSVIEELGVMKLKIRSLLEQHAEESILFGISQIFYSLFFSLLGSLPKASPLSNNVREPDPDQASNSMFGRLSMNYDFWEKSLFEIISFLQAFPLQLRKEVQSRTLSVVLEKTLLAEIIAFVTRDYNPIIHTQILIEYLLLLRPHLSSEKLLNFLRIFVVPKLLIFIQSWDFQFHSHRYVVLLPETNSISASTNGKLFGHDDFFLLHHWILPFLQVIDHEHKDIITQLFPEIRRKMVVVIKKWNVEMQEEELRFDSSEVKQEEKIFHDDCKHSSRDFDLLISTHCQWLIQFIYPWRDIFDRQSYGNVILKALIPKLLQYCRRQFIINPAQQNIIPFESVISLNQIIPDEYFESLICSTFFPSFLPVAFQWLQSFSFSQNEDNGVSNYYHQSQLVGQFVRWYQGWRSLFPTKMFNHVINVPVGNNNLSRKLLAQHLFERCLEFVDIYSTLYAAYLEGGDQSVICLKLSNVNCEVEQFINQVQGFSFFNLIAADLKQSGGSNVVRRSGLQLSTASSTQASSVLFHHITLKDLLQQVAQRLNIEFVFQQKSTQLNKKVYRFGSSLIFLENNVIYHYEEKAGHLWLPISLENLESLTTNR